MSASSTPTTDAQIADDIRRKLTEALHPALEVIREANRQGFLVGFNVGGNPISVQVIEVSKKL